MAKDKKSSSGGASGVEGRAKEAPIVPARNVVVNWDTSDAAIESRLNKERELFGRELSDEDYALLVGAQERTTLNVGVVADKLWIQVQNPFIDSQMRTVEKDSSGNLYMANALFIANSNAPSGFGTKVFTDQVRGARQLGIKYISTYAAGNKNASMNGYYTWPRLGYDGPIPSDKLAAIPQSIRNRMDVGTIQELYKTKEGREWWKENGSEINLRFNTDQNSLSSKVLNAYNQERAKKG